jgi:uncharacterized protein YjbI with pentapeptide repeats
MGYLRFGRGLGWAAWTGFAGETLLDWLELLIIPIFIAVGVWWLDRRQKETEREFEQARLTKDREIAQEKRYDATLEAYFDRMTALLLDEGLRDSEEGDEVRTIARTRTLTVLRRLDASHNEQVLGFLKGMGLIFAESSIDLLYSDIKEADLKGIVNLVDGNMRNANLKGVDLAGADLRMADLRGANLQEAFLIEANLQLAVLLDSDLRCTLLIRANMQGALLRNSNLQGASLLQADLRGADLRNADLRRARELDTVNFDDAKMEGAKVLACDVETLKRAGVHVEVLEVMEESDEA